MFRVKAVLPFVLGAVLAISLPTPAHADISLTSVLSSLMSGLSKLFTGITDAGQTSAAATAGSGRIVADTVVRSGDAVSTNTDNSLKSQARGGIMLQTEDPSDATCQIAANNNDVHQRIIKQEEVMSVITSQFDHLFLDPNTGNTLGKTKIINALCALGAIGQSGRCTTVAPAAKRSKVENGGWSVNTAVISNSCIPFDTAKFMAELNKLAVLPDSGTYTLGDENMREAMVAFLTIRVNRKLSSSPVPTKAEQETISGNENDAQLREKLSPLMGPIRRMLRAMAWNSCLSTTMLPNCTADNSGMIKDLTSHREPNMPTSGFCISEAQKNHAAIILLSDQLKAIGSLGGTVGESFDRALNMENAINERQRRHDEIMQAASDAAAQRVEDTEIGLSARAVQGGK